MNSRRRQGFALPAVLTVTGVVTLIFLVAITALSSLTREARSTRERVRFMESALTAEAMIQYAAATEPLGSAAIIAGSPRTVPFDGTPPPPSPTAVENASIYIDDRPYTIETGTVETHPVTVSLQDQGGLINLARLDEEQMARFGALIGADAGLSRTLRPLYTDYVDEDDLETLNGAEAARYGRDRIGNRALRRPSEFLSLLGVRRAINASAWRTVRPEVGVDPQRTTFNVNTASPVALRVMFGITEQQAEAAVRARRRAPFLSLSDFIAASGANVVDDGEELLTFPQGRIIYTISDTRSAWRYRARLVLTPESLERPFWTDQTEMTEASRTAMASEDATRFPYAPD